MLPGPLIPKALVRIAPGKSIVVKVKQHRAHRAEMTPTLDNPDLGKIMLERVVMRRIASPPLLCRTRCLTPFGEISPPLSQRHATLPRLECSSDQTPRLEAVPR